MNDKVSLSDRYLLQEHILLDEGFNVTRMFRMIRSCVQEESSENGRTIHINSQEGTFSREKSNPNDGLPVVFLHSDDCQYYY